jgi:phosphate-selective porin OprO/OprP
MSGNKWRVSGALSLATILAAGSASAESVTADRIDKLQAQIEALQRELQSMKKKVDTAEKKKADTAEKAYAASTPVVAKAPVAAPPSAIVKMSEGNRPSICTPDGRNCIALTSRLHLDVGGYSYHPDTLATVPQHLDSGFNARRARIGVLGTFMSDWNYALIYDFGGSSDGFGGTAVGSLPGGGTSGIENAYLSYTGIKGLAIEGGYMDVPYTLEEATSSNDIMFLERSSAQTIAASIAAGDFRSVFGARWYNDWLWTGGYVTGPTSGAIHSGSSITPAGMTEQYGAVGRVALQLINDKAYSLHIGGNVEVLAKPPLNRVTNTQTLTLSDRAELRIDPTAVLSTGPIANVSSAQVFGAEAAGSYGPLFFQGEYFLYEVDRTFLTNLPTLHFQGGYASASWAITGESRPYNTGSGAYTSIVPADPFSITGGGRGAWEIAARYSYVNLNDRLGFADGIAGGKQTIYTAGLNWYPNRNVRFMVNYLHTIIDKQISAVNPGDAGATIDAVAMRTQVAF